LPVGTAIHLRRRLPGASSGFTRDMGRAAPGAANRSAPVQPCSGRGLPGRPVTRPPVGSYPTISPLPRAAPMARPPLCPFCGTLLRVTPTGRYPAPLLCGARTFLGRRKPPAAVRPACRLSLPATRDSHPRHEPPPRAETPRPGTPARPRARAYWPPPPTTSCDGAVPVHMFALTANSPAATVRPAVEESGEKWGT
jgi:hypothetical protein